jgi:hypothetical protein
MKLVQWKRSKLKEVRSVTNLTWYVCICLPLAPLLDALSFFREPNSLPAKTFYSFQLQLYCGFRNTAGVIKVYVILKWLNVEDPMSRCPAKTSGASGPIGGFPSVMT